MSGSPRANLADGQRQHISWAQSFHGDQTLIVFESLRRVTAEQIWRQTQELKSLKELEVLGLGGKAKLRAVDRDPVYLRGEELGSRLACTRKAVSTRGGKFQVQKTFQAEVAAELRNARSEGFELEERASTIHRPMELAKLRASVDGAVAELKVHTPCGVILSSEVLMKILPSADSLSVKARVLPQDMDCIVTIDLRTEPTFVGMKVELVRQKLPGWATKKYSRACKQTSLSERAPNPVGLVAPTIG